MESLNEVVPKKYQLKRNFTDVVAESDDLGSLMPQYEAAKSSGDSHVYAVIDTGSRQVLHRSRPQNQ